MFGVGRVPLRPGAMEVKRAPIKPGNKARHKAPTPMFFVSVDSRRFNFSVSRLESILVDYSGTVDSTRFRSNHNSPMLPTFAKVVSWIPFGGRACRAEGWSEKKKREEASRSPNKVLYRQYFAGLVKIGRMEISGVS